MKKNYLKNNIAVVCFLAAIIFAVSVIIFRFSNGLKVDSSILSLISNDKKNQFIHDLTDNAANELSRKVFFLIEDESEENAIISAQKTMNLAVNSGIFNEIFSGSTSEMEKEFFDWFFPQKYSILSDELRSIIENPNGYEKFTENYNNRIFAPMPDFYGENLNADPLMLFLDKMLELNGNSQWLSADGFLIYPADTTAILITATISGDSFSPKTQNDLENLITQIKNNISSNISTTSLVRYAKLGFEEGKRDAGIIGTISFIGVVLLLLIVFRNIWTIFAGLIPIFCGLIFAFGALFLFSPEINGIALSMGACFVGIVIDYSLHYLVQNEEMPKIRLKSIISGLSIGVFSTIAGFSAFFFTPIAGLRHIAIMSVFGLFGAYLSVIILLPHIKSANKKLPIKIPRIFNWQIPNSLKTIIISAVIIISIFGILKVKYNDDINNFRSPAPNLEAEEAILQKYTGNTEGNKFLVVLGKNDDEMLDNLSKVSISLNYMKNNGIIENYRSIGQYLSSEKQSKENRENLLRILNENDGEILNYLKNLGFKDSVLQNMKLEISHNNKILNLDFLLNSSVGKNFNMSTVLRNDSISAALILFDGISDENAMKSLENEKTVFYINRVSQISSVLREYRENMQKTLLIAIAVIFSFILIYFTIKRNFSTAVSVIIPPFLTLISVQAILGFCGVEQNLMHGVGQLLVLGVGIDYAVFRALSQKHSDETNFAVLLSAITTFMAFGLLLFTTTAALKSMGQVVAPGIILSYLFSWLVNKKIITN